MNKRVQVIKYITADFLAAILAWTLFFIYRKYRVDHGVMDHFHVVLDDAKLYYGLVVIGLFWLALYTLIGTYRQIYRKARLREFAQTFRVACEDFSHSLPAVLRSSVCKVQVPGLSGRASACTSPAWPGRSPSGSPLARAASAC